MSESGSYLACFYAVAEHDRACSKPDIVQWWQLGNLSCQTGVTHGKLVQQVQEPEKLEGVGKDRLGKGLSASIRHPSVLCRYGLENEVATFNCITIRPFLQP